MWLTRQKLSSRLVIFALLMLLAFLGRQEYRLYSNQKQIERQKNSLMEQTDALQKKNDELSKSLEYLNSPDFKERAARQQLNLKREGENVYAFSDAQSPASSQTGTGAKSGNFQKWWNYFFSN